MVGQIELEDNVRTNFVLINCEEYTLFILKYLSF
jgi:hypothetical protein